MIKRRRPLIAANWKMNGLRRDGTALAQAVVDRVAGRGDLAAEIALCPPATLLSLVAQLLQGQPIWLGAQDCSAMPGGAYTGEISASMLTDLGVKAVILGHSERRAQHHETDAIVRAKATAAAAAGLVTILCVGETADERDRGRALDVVGAQVQASVPDGATSDQLVIAYEPIWAIGTGRIPSLDDIAAMHAHIRGLLAQPLQTRILYGGSVKPANARDILALDDVDGALVGGASLKIDEFWPIIEAARH